jgi:hypothetical protein
MAENTVAQLRSQPPMPEYFNFDQIQKEEFLSQLGNFNQEQRAIFHKLCEIWEPEIDYDRFIELGKNQFSFIQSHLTQLMQKLFNARCGLLKITAKQGSITNSQVILCERDSIRFFYYYLENEYYYSLYSEDKFFITSKFLENQEVHIPGSYVESLSLNDIGEGLVADNKDNVRIFLIKSENYDPIYATPATIAHLIHLSREKVKQLLKSSQLLTFISKTMGLMESEILKNIKDRDHSFWNKLCRTLMENKEDVAEKRRHIAPDYYPALSFVYAYTRNGLEEAERIRLDKQSQKDELISICQAIELGDEKFITQQELNDYLSHGISKWPDFKDTFYDQCVKVKNKTSLPLIVNVGNGYIHRDHIYLTFRVELREAAIELKQHYLSLMDELLTSRRREGVNAFSSTDSFVHSIHENIKERFPLLSMLLDKPKILSESIIHWSKKRSNNPSADQVRVILAKFFEEDSTLKFIRIDKMLELYQVELFKQAFDRLSLLRKIILRLFGRYDTMLESFNGLSQSGNRKNTRTNGVKTAYSSSRSNESYKNMSASDKPEGGVIRSKRKYRPDTKVKNKRYSNREQNNAWNDFQSALQKKKE